MIHIGLLFIANMACFGRACGWHRTPTPRRPHVVAIDIPGRQSIPVMLARLRRGTHLAHHGVRCDEDRPTPPKEAA